ncbi:MAG: ATP-binding protein [Myxococcota bacterium]
MQKVNTSAQDEKTIRWVMSELEQLTQVDSYYARSARETSDEEEGEGTGSRLPKLLALRVALALSLKEGGIPEQVPVPTGKGAEYSLNQVTGAGRTGGQDLTEGLRALLSVRHDEDLFGVPNKEDPEALDRRYVQLLYAHISRGLRSIERMRAAQKLLVQMILEMLFGETSKSGGATQLEGRLRQRMLSVEVLSEVRGGCSYAIALRYWNDEVPKRFNKKLCDELAFEMGWPDNSTFVLKGAEPNTLWLETALGRPQWETFGDTVVEAWLNRPQADDACLLVAVRGERERLSLPLDQAVFHLIIGEAEAGKTSLLRSLVMQWGLCHPTEEVILLDQESSSEWVRFKGFSDFSVYTLEELRSQEGPNAYLWRRLRSGDKPRLLVIDNAESIVDSFPSFEDQLVRLLGEAPESLHILVASDARFANTFLERHPELQQRLGGRLLMKVQSPEQSYKLLHCVGAERLQGEGDVIVYVRERMSRGRVPLVTWDQLRLKLRNRGLK